MIVDSQIHVWGTWASTVRARHREGPFTGDMVLSELDSAGVDRALLVPSYWAADGDLVALAAAHAHPDRFAVVDVLRLEQPLDAEAFATWRSRPGLLGARLVFPPEFEAQLHDGTADWAWHAADEASLPVFVHAPGSFEMLGALAQRYSGLRIVIDHLGLPPEVRGNAITPHIDALLDLARLANVAVKASALPLWSTEPFPFRDLHEPVRRVVEAFGPSRVFWGSDRTRLTVPYREAVAMLHAVDGLAPELVDRILGPSILDWVGWPVAR